MNRFIVGILRRPHQPFCQRRMRMDHTGHLREGRPHLHHNGGFMDQIGVERATLLGNSLGCPIIGEFLDHFPDRAERVIFVSPAGGLYNQQAHMIVMNTLVSGNDNPINRTLGGNQLQGQVARVASVNAGAGTITISPGLHFALSSSRNPKI